MAADAAALADAVAEAVRGTAVPVARVRADDFLRARSLRLEYGRDDPDAFHDLWYDVAALRREVLDPLGAGGDGRFLPRLRDPGTDRAVKVPPVEAAPGTVLVLDGRFLLRDDVRDAFDVTVHLDVSPRRPRAPAAGGRGGAGAAGLGPLPGRVGPAGRADVVVRFDHPDRPAVVERT